MRNRSRIVFPRGDGLLVGALRLANWHCDDGSSASAEGGVRARKGGGILVVWWVQRVRCLRFVYHTTTLRAGHHPNVRSPLSSKARQAEQPFICCITSCTFYLC